MRSNLLVRVLPVLAIAAIAIVAGCGNEPAQSGGNRLTIWESYNNEEHGVFLEVVEQFKKKKKEAGVDVSIEVGRVPYDGLLPKLKAACLTSTTPDICRIDYAHVVPLAYGGAIYALDKELKLSQDSLDKLRSEFVPAAIDSCLFLIRRKGEPEATRHLFGLPDQTTSVVVFYNTELFRASEKELKAAGLDPERTPATWDEFIRYGKILTKRLPNGTWQYAIGLNNSLWWSLPFINTYGAPILEQNAKNGMFRCVLDDPKTVEAFKFKADLSLVQHKLADGENSIEAKAWMPAAVTPDQGFQNGVYAMILSGPWNLKVFREAKVPFKVAMVPKGPAGSSSTVGGTNLVVFRSCKNPGLAWELLQFVTNEEQQRSWCRRLGQIPVRPALFKDASLTQGREELRVFFDQLLTAVARPPVPYYDKIEELANAEMALALQGKKTPTVALRDASERINSEVLAGLVEN